jgi:hypothetical protein
MMTTSNNSYLYNLILSSSLINYDDQYTAISGMDASLALYLLSYSKELFFSYITKFNECSIVADTDLFFNVCLGIIHTIPSASHIVYNNERIRFQYLNRFNFNIYSPNNLSPFNILYNSNEPIEYLYNGILFRVPSIESVITYCIHQYSELNKNLEYLTNVAVLSTIYKSSIITNNILINILKLNINIQKTIKSMIKDISSDKIIPVPFLNFSNNVVKKRTVEILEFCYG